MQNTLDDTTQISLSGVTLIKEPSDLDITATVEQQFGGEGIIVLSAPGENNVGDIDVVLDLIGNGLDFLQHDWPNYGNEDGASDDAPSGRASFGISSGEDDVIFIRELY